MPIRGARNPFPKKKPATNSGIFSKSGAGQKMDRAAKVAPGTKRGFVEAYRNINYKRAGT